MAILKNERYYSYYWSNKTGASLKDRISKIYVGARGLATDKGYVIVEFYFENGPSRAVTMQNENQKREHFDTSPAAACGLGLELALV
jgi:hypothetical protein